MTLHFADARAADLPLLPGGAGGLRLAGGRVHEFCGPARRTLAAMTAGATGPGPVVWIAPAWLPERLCPAGLVRLLDPARVIFVQARRVDDLLWSLEEVLRSGAAAAAVAELPDPPALTPTRRLQLAAEAGGGPGRGAVLGLLLTPGDGGAAGAETRWHMAQAPDGGWRLVRRRARMAPPAAWAVTPVRGGVTATPTAAD